MVWEDTDAVPSSARQSGLSRHGIASRAWPRWRGRKTLVHPGRRPLGATGSRRSRLDGSHGPCWLPEIVRRLPSARSLATARSDGAWQGPQGDRCHEGLRAGHDDLRIARSRDRGDATVDHGQKRSGRARLAGFGGNHSPRPPRKRTAHRSHQGVGSHRCLRKASAADLVVIGPAGLAGVVVNK